MSKQSNLYADGGAEPRSGEAGSAELPMSSGQVQNAVDGALRMMELEQAASPQAPTGILGANAQNLDAHADRRKKLAARIRAECPACTEEEIEARLEQFGA